MAGEADCIFCAIAAGDAPAEIVDSDEYTVAFMDINPATRGHALVIPRTHSADLMEIDDEDLERTNLAARRLARRMDETLAPRASTSSTPAGPRRGRPCSTSICT